jgi:hypothetical protein
VTKHCVLRRWYYCLCRQSDVFISAVPIYVCTVTRCTLKCDEVCHVGSTYYELNIVMNFMVAHKVPACHGRHRLTVSTIFNICMIWYDIFVSCNWVDTRWQQYSTHLHTDSTQNDTMKQITQNGTEQNGTERNVTERNMHNNKDTLIKKPNIKIGIHNVT